MQIQSGVGQPSLRKLQEAIGTDPFEKQLAPLGPITSRGRSVQPSVKYIND